MIQAKKAPKDTKNFRNPTSLQCVFNNIAGVSEVRNSGDTYLNLNSLYKSENMSMCVKSQVFFDNP